MHTGYQLVRLTKRVLDRENVSRILAHSPEGVLLAMESPSPAPAKERKPLDVFIDYLKESRKYDQTATYLDLSSACRRD